MSSTLLELIRTKHETAEVFERQIGAILDEKPNGQKAKVKQQHAIKKCVDLIASTNQDLKGLYADKDHLLQDEIASMRGNQMFKYFYENLNSIREYHVKYPSDNDKQSSFPTLHDDEIERGMVFSGEEVFGKYLDLHELYFEYCNIPNITTSNEQDYLQYLDRFNSFFHISESVKIQKQYKNYIDGLWYYLSTFFIKIQPLVEIQELTKDWRADFESKWSSGKMLGWKPKVITKKGDPQPLRLGMFNTVEELEALGMDRLKEGLEALGLKCGGTLKDRAARLWSVRGKKAEDIPEKLKAKPSGSDSVVPGSKRKLDDMQDDRRKDLAWTEYKIICLSDVMMDVITATRRHAAKQQTRTAEEKEMELYEEEFGTNQDLSDMAKGNDDDEDEPIYNPLNLPLGWDGKPIPYWLYKLHGLGVEYKCEICGNQSYWGRRNFDRHFQEWRHGYGMRCLGIPNTKHFHDITLIEDAITLYSKIREQLKTEQFISELEEEFEDSQGNVLNRRTYEDLARQGLL